MAKYSGILQGKVRGKIGGIVFTEVSGVGTVGREYVAKPSNPKSYAQQVRRVMLANLVNLYKSGEGWMKSAFETKKAGQSDYNRFVSLNLNRSRIALTKEQAANGSCVAAAYDVSEGTLPSIALNKTGDRQFATNIVLGTLEITAETTVGEFSAAVTANNAHIMNGMQITFVSYMQTVDDVTGFPRVVCTPYEVTLDSASTALLNDFLPISFAAASIGSTNKYLGTGPTLADGAFCYILSSRVGGKIKVSSQRLQLVRGSIYSTFVTDAQIQLAVQSYGASANAMLAPGSVSSSATPRLQGISFVSGLLIGDTSTKTLKQISEDSLSIQMLAPFNTVDYVKVAAADGTTLTNNDYETEPENSILAHFATSSSTKYVVSVVVSVDGIEYSAAFEEPLPSGGGGDDDDDGGLAG